MIHHSTMHVCDPQTSLPHLNLLGFSAAWFTYCILHDSILVCILLANFLPSIVLVCNFLISINIL
jgi:hypothetical protein